MKFLSFIVPMILRDTIGEAMLLICLSEYLYHNKNEYFDLLRTMQYSGGYIRWIKFFVNAVGQAAERSAEILMQYEQLIAKDLVYLMRVGNVSKSVFAVYKYLKSCPVISCPVVAKCIGLSFNSVLKAMHILQKYGIAIQVSVNARNRIWIHAPLMTLMICKEKKND